MASPKNTFVFGAGAGAGEFDFSAGSSNPFAADPAPASASNSSLPAAPSGSIYVTLAQYELIEARYEDVLKRLEILEAENKGHEATKKMLKTGAANLERSYQSLQKTHQSGEEKIKALELENHALSKKLDICKSALQMSQDQHRATSQDLDAALKRHEEAQKMVSAPSPTHKAPSMGFSTIQSIDLAPVVASPVSPPPTLSYSPVVPVLSVEPIEPDAPKARSPAAQTTLSFSPVVTVMSLEPVAPQVSPTSSPTLAPIVDLAPAAVKPSFQESLDLTTAIAANAESILNGQHVVQWHLVLLLLLLTAWVALWLVSGDPNEAAPLGFGGISGLGDGLVGRVHASVLGMLVMWSGGLEVFV